MLIGGDFNTNDMQWVSHIVPVPWPGWQAARVRDLMAQNGYNTPFMNQAGHFRSSGMQLDWIFLRNLATIRADIVPMGFSDHHALVAVVGPPGPEKNCRSTPRVRWRIFVLQNELFAPCGRDEIGGYN